MHAYEAPAELGEAREVEPLERSLKRSSGARPKPFEMPRSPFEEEKTQLGYGYLAPANPRAWNGARKLRKRPKRLSNPNYPRLSDAEREEVANSDSPVAQVAKRFRISEYYVQELRRRRNRNADQRSGSAARSLEA